MTVLRIIGKYGKILSRHQKKRIFELGILMIIGGILESFSMYLIMPFTTAIMDEAGTMSNPYIQKFCALFRLQSHRGFLVALALIMAALYMLKNLFLLFQMWVQKRFVFNNMFITQQKLLYRYLMQPYEYYLGVKSGQVLRVIGSDTSAAFNLLVTLLSMISEIVVAVIMIIVLFQINKTMTVLIAAMMILMAIVVQVSVRSKLQEAGQRNRKASAEMNQSLVQSIQGIKEVKVMRRENFFMQKFAENGSVYVRTMYQNQTLGLSPRFMMEAFSISVMFVAIALLIYRGMPLERIVPLLSGVAMAAFRLLPSVNRITQCMGDIAYGEPSVDQMIRNLKDFSDMPKGEAFEEGKGRISGISDELVFDKITYRYPTGNENVLDNASMEIKKGMSVGIVGPSGAGKTTTVDILLGLLHAKKGQVLVDGTDISEDMGGWLENVGYIPQTIFMLDGDIRENIVFGLTDEEINDDKVWEALREAAIDDFVRSLPEGLETEIGERGVRLSGGQRQRLGIARALYRDPEVLVFDEATSALDNDTEAEIMEAINGLHGQKTMIIIAHRLTTIENCDVVYRVEDGKITLERSA